MNKSTLYFSLAALMTVSWASYYLYQKYKKNPLKLQISKLRKIIQEIKYQILITCISHHVQLLKRAGMLDLKRPDIMEYLRVQLNKQYRQKQMLVLSRYSIDTQTYGEGLNQNKNDDFLRKAQAQIIDMLQRTLNGKMPDLSVNPEAYNQFSKKDIKQIYLELSKQLVKAVLNKLKQCLRDDPLFNSKDNILYRNAIRSLDIYNLKVKFALSKGFKDVWGCPYESFLKMLQNFKFQDSEFRDEICSIEKDYNAAIHAVSDYPADFSEKDVKQFFTIKYNQQQQKLIIEDHKHELRFVQANSVQQQQLSQIIMKEQKDNKLIKPESNNSEYLKVLNSVKQQLTEQKLNPHQESFQQNPNILSSLDNQAKQQNLQYLSISPQDE